MWSCSLVKRSIPTTKLRAWKQGADDYVVRPVSNRELLARVRAMLRLRRAEELRRAQMHELRERVKELNCLYGISELIEKAEFSLPRILQGAVDLIPPAWQYPEITCARIVLDEQTFQTRSFREGTCRQSHDIRVHGGRTVGSRSITWKSVPKRMKAPS